MSANVDRQLAGLHDALIRDLQAAVEALTRATVQAARQDYPSAREFARTAADLSADGARTAGLMALLD